MHTYTHDIKGIYKDGELMTPQEIVNELQISDMLAEFSIMVNQETIEIPKNIRTSDDFISWGKSAMNNAEKAIKECKKL